MNLVERVKNILISPASEWEVIKTEEYTESDLFIQYAVKLAAIPAIAGLIGFTIFGFSYGPGTFQPSFGSSLKWALAMYVLSLVGAYVIAFIVDVLAPSFGSQRNILDSLKVVIFSYTASWVGGVFSLIPAISFLGFLTSIYSLVLLYMGLKRVKEVPDDKMVTYFIVTIAISIVVYIITGSIITMFAFQF